MARYTTQPAVLIDLRTCALLCLNPSGYSTVSRSEAGQQKHLLVLDSDWRQTEEILLDLGPRFHAMMGAQPSLPQGLRPGDRLDSCCPCAISVARSWILQVLPSPGEEDFQDSMDYAD